MAVTAGGEVAAEVRVAARDLDARVEPRAGSARLGVVASGAPFAVYAHVEGPGCGDWGLLARGAYACLDRTSLVADPPAHLPDAEIGELPYLYARRGSGAPGPIYASLEAWEAGARPVSWFEPEHSYHFVSVVPTAKGDVLLAPDGRVVPLAQAKLYEPDDLAGRDLLLEPLDTGAVLAWCVEAEGCPTADGAALAWQDDFVVGTVSFTGTPKVRTWVPAPRPEGIAEDELWVDVHLAEQTLALVRGDTPELVTLISAGVGGRYATPKGVFRVLDKLVDNDMINLPGAADSYHVERVPWVAHFKPRYALHGAYWHTGFGQARSHGCVNLSPADAHRVFDAIRPELPPGWRAAWPTEAEPGTVIRIR